MYLVVLIASLMIFCAVVFAFANSPYVSVFHPFTFYCSFHGLVFVIRPLLSFWLNYEMLYRVFKFMPSQADKITAIGAANVGFLAFGFFVFRKGAVAMRFKSDAFSDAEKRRLTSYFCWVVALAAPFAFWSLLTTYNMAANFEVASNMRRDAASGVMFNTDTTGYFVEAQLMLATLGAVLAWLLRFRLVAIAPLVAFVLLRAGSGGRGPFVTALVSASLFYLYEKRKRMPNIRTLALAAVLAFGFVQIGSDRGLTLRSLFGAQTDFREIQTSSLKFGEGMDFANLEFLEYLVTMIPDRTHTYGYFNDVLQVFTEPVPRVLWPGKPFGAPFERISLLDYGNPIGMTRSMPGEGWYSLGWAGVVIWCGLCGYVLGYVYRRFALSEQNTFQVAAYIMFLPILIVAYRDGQLVTVFRQGIFYLGPILLWLAFSRLSGVKMASEMRRIFARSQANSPAGALPAGPPLTKLQGLPPAVRRRKTMLAQQRDQLDE